MGVVGGEECGIRASGEAGAEEGADAASWEERWGETAHRWSFAQINELIERHNRNFPAEARLPMDPRTRDFVKINGEPYAREPLDAEWILAHWPAELDAARDSADRRRPRRRSLPAA